MFKAVPDPKNEITWKWLNSLKDRTLKYQKSLLYYSSLYLKDQVKSYITPSLDTKDYIEGIQQAVVTLQNIKDSMYAVVLNPRLSRVKKLNPQKSLIIIRAKRRLGKPDPKAFVLEKYSPWTMDTIPFMPDKRNADIINKNTSEVECLRISSERKKDALYWKRELIKLGAILPKDATKLDISKSVKSSSDMAYEAYRMEFGLDGKKSGSHWRRGVSDLISMGIPSIIKQKNLVRILSDPNYIDWKKELPQVRVRVTPSEARAFSVFQKKLGIIQ